MPGTSLFGVSNDGRVYVLSTVGARWHELDYLGIEFKHVSAVPNYVWAVGGDRQIYVHVHGLDIPIRIKEESYENQRWLPMDGFSAKLLPTDRFHYSNEEGIIDRSWDKVELPSRAWAWESDWHIETVMDDGQPLDHEGWMYALDFPATYYPQKQWKSCVRRRKWVRYRRYVALNSWCALPPLHRDLTQEPFIDISVGGHQIPSILPGSLCVWVITVQGRVLFRNGITANSPEGSHWIGIPLMPRCEPAQLCVGPSGHVWCVLWDGRILVRDQISREQLQGMCWIEITSPEGKKIKQVAVGINVVWAVAMDNSVWFRRGVSIPDRPAGLNWVHMVGEMAQVSVGANDQVWAIGAEDRSIYFRSGVDREEMTGRTWRKIQVGIRKIITKRESSSSLDSTNSSPLPTRHHVHHLGTSAIVEKATDSFIHRSSSPKKSVINTSGLGSSTTSSQLAGSLDNLTISDNQAADISALLAGQNTEGACSSLPSNYIQCKQINKLLQDGSKSLNQIESRLSGTDSSETDSLFGEDESVFMTDFMPKLIHETDDICQQSWNWVAAGACTVDSSQLPNYWFNDANSSNKSLNKICEPWRNKIMEELKDNNYTDNNGFEIYETAVDLVSWVKAGKAKVMVPKGNYYEDCLIELEWVGGVQGNNAAATLTLLPPDQSRIKAQMSVSNLAIAMVTSEPRLPRLTIYESKSATKLVDSKNRHLEILPNYLQLSFAAEKDMEDWLSNINTVCCELQKIIGKPNNNSIWGLTSLGDIFVWDPKTMEQYQHISYKENILSHELASSPQSIPCESHLTNAFCLGSAIQITGRPLGKANRFFINIQSYWGHVSNATRYIALHFNPRFKDKVIVRNSMEGGQWGEEETDGEFILERDEEFCIRFECQTDCIMIYIDGNEYTKFKHRLRPEHMSFIHIEGDLVVSSIIYESAKLSLAPSEMFWRQMGGHLRKIETCDDGIVWGIGYDGRAWVYNGGCGGGCLLASDTENESVINSMSDVQSYYVYENQRWNPLAGYSARGLPTDRPPWSDKSGRIKIIKENIKLRSMHWQWATDWRVDFHVKGGVDKEGWQYAVDFPATYHGKKRFTDYVRRRRWERKCIINTSGPWIEIGGSKLQDISLMAEDGKTVVWAVAANGDALFRQGISKETPQGDGWIHVPGEHSLSGIAIGKDNKLWAVGKNGSALRRIGITPSNPLGEEWSLIDSPGPLLQISVYNDVWALDKEGKAYLRRDINSVCPDGSHWLITTDTPDAGGKFIRHISCGPSGLWAVLGNNEEPGILGLRCGITDKISAGNSWNTLAVTGWQHISARCTWDIST